MDPDAADFQASTEDRLTRATVGAVVPHNAAVHLVPYDPAWPRLYAAHAAEICAALGPAVRQIAHVGSTSVPGLSAKPVIDIVLAVPDSNDEDAYVPLLERHGYVLKIREPDWFAHRMLKLPANTGNLHVFSHRCPEIDRMIAFRDWLRANAEDRLLYERTKQELSTRTWKHIQNYADAKSEVVREILERALKAR